MNLTRLFVFYNLPPPPLSLHISLGSGVTKGLIVLGARGNNLGTLRESWIPHYIFSEIAVANPGQVPPPHPTPLGLDHKLRPEGPKKFFGDPATVLSQGLDNRSAPSPLRPPYLKVWIRH